MNTTISTPVRVVALAGLLLAVAGGGASLLLNRPSGAEHTPQAPVRHRHVTAPAPARTTAPAKPASRTAAKPVSHAPARPATHAAARPAAHPRPAHRGNLVDARLPRALQWALSQHRIVVVALYQPGSDVDAISVAEAHAGAADAGVGFLLVNVLDNSVAGPLTALLPGGGLLPDPGILVYRAPGELVYRADGFLDRDAVAQAAENARSDSVDSTVAAPGAGTSGS